MGTNSRRHQEYVIGTGRNLVRIGRAGAMILISTGKAALDPGTVRPVELRHEQVRDLVRALAVLGGNHGALLEAIALADAGEDEAARIVDAKDPRGAR